MVCADVKVQLVKALETPIDFEDCVGSSGTISTVDVSPYPVKLGKDLTVSVTGKASTKFSINNIHSVVSVAGIPLVK